MLLLFWWENVFPRLYFPSYEDGGKRDRFSQVLLDQFQTSQGEA